MTIKDPQVETLRAILKICVTAIGSNKSIPLDVLKPLYDIKTLIDQVGINMAETTPLEAPVPPKRGRPRKSPDDIPSKLHSLQALSEYIEKDDFNTLDEGAVDELLKALNWAIAYIDKHYKKSL